jgi:hypothetical protein
LKDAYYFSHDSNARNDTKILAMRCDYGVEGYGMYWIIIETLRDESNYKLKLEDKTYKALAMQMQSKSEEVESFINDCINEYELFVDDGVYFWAESLLRRMEKKDDIKEKRKKAAEARWQKTDKVDDEDIQKQSKSNASAKQLDAKERKGKERKLKKSKYKEYVLLTPEEYEKLLERLSTSERDDYIERLNDYIGQTGKKYKSHYHTILNWHRRDEGNATGTHKANGRTEGEGNDLATRAGVLSL